MGKKKEEKGAKKLPSKEQKKIIEDKTFGLKNKNKSTKVQKFVKSVAHAVKTGGRIGEQALKELEFKEKAEKRKQAEKDAIIASLLKSVDSVKQQQPKEGESFKSILCAFFKAGICKKGDKCKFSHDLEIEKRAAKADLYTDIREINKADNMTTWDQGYLETVIAEKNKKRTLVPSSIACKYFLDAVESGVYGWFWECPNGETCQYKHCLPPGFVLKRDKERKEKLDKLEEKLIEEIVDGEREELHKKATLTPLTLENFNAWKKRKQEEREKKMLDEIKKESKKTGGKASHMLTGRALFKYDPTAFQDDEDAVEEYKEEPEGETPEEGKATEEEKGVSFKVWNTATDEEIAIQKTIEQVKKTEEAVAILPSADKKEEDEKVPAKDEKGCADGEEKKGDDSSESSGKEEEGDDKNDGEGDGVPGPEVPKEAPSELPKEAPLN